MSFQRLLGIHIIIGTNVFLSFGLIVTYSMSVGFKHVKPLWCYISYTGDYPLESCIFSVVLNIVSAAYTFIVYLRFLQVSAILPTQNLPEKTTVRLKLCNMASLFFGMLGTFGLSITACFQHRLFHLMHLTGVFLATYFTLIYVIMQTYFTFAVSSLCSVFLKRFRLVLTVIASFILSFGPGLFVYFLMCHTEDFEPLEAEREIQRDEVGDKVGAALEWTLFLSYHLFIYSFCPDFKKVVLEKDQIVFLYD